MLTIVPFPKPSKLSEIIAQYQQHDLPTLELNVQMEAIYRTAPANKLPNSPSEAIKGCDAQL